MNPSKLVDDSFGVLWLWDSGNNCWFRL